MWGSHRGALDTLQGPKSWPCCDCHLPSQPPGPAPAHPWQTRWGSAFRRHLSLMSSQSGDAQLFGGSCWCPPRGKQRWPGAWW